MDSADVVVIGAGLIGSSIAWRLAQRGSKVVLIDRGEPGSEASWAAAGVLIPSAGEGDQSLFAFFRESHEAYPSFVEEVRETTGAAFEFRTCGQLVLSFDEAFDSVLAHRAALQHAANFPAELLTGEEARRLEPAINPSVRSALRYPTHGLVDNRLLSRSATLAAAAAGAVVRSHEPVQRLVVESGRVTGVETSRATIAADIVVNAAGCWSSELTPWLRGTMTAAKGEIIAFRLWRRPVEHIISVNSGSGSVSTRSDGRVLAHATRTDGVFDKNVRGSSIRFLIGLAEMAVPGLSEAPIYEAWAGLRPLSSDGLPLIGFDRRAGLIWATGHLGMGILAAPITADVVTRLIYHESPSVEIGLFSPQRFERQSVVV
jgi:glycine oxidase